MSKVIQIRDVPDQVHALLFEAAEAQGLSLTSYLNLELARLARRPQVVQHNVEVVRRTQDRVRGSIDRAAIQAALRDGRDER